MPRPSVPIALQPADGPAPEALILGARDIADVKSAALKVTCITDLAGLAAIGPQWQALQSRAAAATVFQTHAQTSIWAENFIRPGQADLLVIAVYDRFDLVMVLPLYVTASMGVRTARITGQPIAQYSDVIAAAGADVDKAFAAALAALRQARVDVLALDRVRDDSVLHRVTARLKPTALTPRVAPYSDLTVAPDHDSFVRGRSKNLLHNLRNRRKQADKAHQVTFETLEGGAEARAAMADAIDFKREWLVERGAMSSAFVDPITNACLLDIAERCPGALVMRMLLDGEPAAIRFGFEYHGTFFAYMSAYSDKFSQFSPGKLLMDHCVAQIRVRGDDTLDMLPPAGEHKAVWCDTAMGVADYIVPLTLAGRIHSGLVRERIIPAMRWTWHHLPAPIRALVARHLLKI